MKVIKVKNYEEMSKKAASIIIGQATLNPQSVFGLATGSTPIGTYEWISKMNKEGLVDFSEIKTVNLDEYCGLDADNVQSYNYFMQINLFNKININPKNTNLPNGMAKNFDQECKDYEKLIDDLGGIDLQLLGIGNNGHIGFNEPSDIFIKKTHMIKLTQNTIEANSRLFAEGQKVPEYALTMGIETIMKAKKVLLVASGKSKAQVIADTINGDVDPKLPASILSLHPDVTIIADEDALSLV